jgi:hypothetical protein
MSMTTLGQMEVEASFPFCILVMVYTSDLRRKPVTPLNAQDDQLNRMDSQSFSCR